MSQKTTGWLVVVQKHPQGHWSALHPPSGFTGWGQTEAKAREATRTYLLQANISPDYLGVGTAERLYDE